MQAQRGSSGDGNAHRNVIEEEKKNKMNNRVQMKLYEALKLNQSIVKVIILICPASTSRQCT